MSNEQERTPAKPTGRRYQSVDALMRGEGVSSDVKAKVAELESEARVSLYLAKVRLQAGLTQEQMAKRLMVTQSAISKLESAEDDEITIKQIKAYCKATSYRICMGFGKPPTHVEAINGHTQGIKQNLEALAKIANQYDELEKDIQAFVGTACSNILSILAKVPDQFPNSHRTEREVCVEIVKNEQMEQKQTTKSKTMAA